MESVVFDSMQVVHRIEIIEAYKSAIGDVIAYVWLAIVALLIFLAFAGVFDKKT